ncbi:MAG TPA: hypothetical protein DDZ38_00740 [Gammaproteobacteria bacterium]|nr:hypothetical protein [Gammaproteobacteria bacterium]
MHVHFFTINSYLQTYFCTFNHGGRFQRMSVESLFYLSTGLTLLGWAALIFFPQRFVAAAPDLGRWVPIAVSLLYVALFFAFFERAPAGTAFTSLGGLTLAFSVPEMVLVGWLHYLAVDLLLGLWQLRDSRSVGISHAYMVPILLLTCIAAPIGFLAYQLLRTVYLYSLNLQSSVTMGSGPDVGH